MKKLRKLLHCKTSSHVSKKNDPSFIHVLFSSSQIGRFGISQREIGVSDREIFAR